MPQCPLGQANAEKRYFRHSSESWNPVKSMQWAPAFAGVTGLFRGSLGDGFSKKAGLAREVLYRNPRAWSLKTSGFHPPPLVLSSAVYRARFFFAVAAHAGDNGSKDDAAPAVA